MIRSLWVEFELGLVIEIRHLGLSLGLELEVGVRVSIKDIISDQTFSVIVFSGWN